MTSNVHIIVWGAKKCIIEALASKNTLYKFNLAEILRNKEGDEWHWKAREGDSGVSQKSL